MTEPFVFEDVPLDSSNARLFLRISYAPGFHVEREAVARGRSTDLGTFRFPTPTSLMEFNQGERKVFESRPAR